MRGLVIEARSGVSRKKCGVLGRGVRVLCGRRLGVRMGIKGWCWAVSHIPDEQLLRQMLTQAQWSSERRVRQMRRVWCGWEGADPLIRPKDGAPRKMPACRENVAVAV